MPEHLTDSIQDYLKIIYELTQDGKTASTTELAKQLGIKPASVTGMVQKLASANHALITYKKHQGVILTEKGRKAALEVIRHHRLIETWLAQTLGYSWDEVHNEAEKLEHVISEEFEARIAAAMGNPMRDPHGDPIPTADLVMPKYENITLSSLQLDQEATICKVQSQDISLLQHLENLGLVIGAHVKIIEISPYDQVMKLKVQGRKEAVVLGPVVTDRVFVEF